MTKRPTLAEQLAEANDTIADVRRALDASRSAGVAAERRAEERKQEIADLRDQVHHLELDLARMGGYLDRIAEDEEPPRLLPRDRRYGRSPGHVMSLDEARHAGGAASYGRPTPAPWYRR